MEGETLGHLIIPSESSTNNGLLLCQPLSEPPSQATLLIEGVARAGTSGMASLAQSAGWNMGAKPPSWEDPDWIHGVKFGADIEALVSRRNIEHVRWGFKYPGLLNVWCNKWERFLSQLRNPRVVIMYRDVVAVDCRAWSAVRNHSILDAMTQLQRLTRWAIGTSFPVALVSYEKLLQHPDGLRDGLETFLGGAIDWGLVSPNDHAYIEQMGTAK
jgi:hypothetical protein